MSSFMADIEAALVEFRALAEERMTSRAIAKRVDPENPGTDADGLEVDGWTTQHTDLPCFVDNSGRGTSGTRTVTVAGVETQVALRVIKVPALTENIDDGDVLYIASGETAGHYFQVLEGTPADQKKQRELGVFEIPAPEGWS